MTSNDSGRRRTSVLTIYTGDYLARIQHLEAKARAIEAAAADGPRLLHELPEHVEVARKHDDLVAEAEASATRVTVQAPRRSTWKPLISEHPPRSKDEVSESDFEVDRFYGFNHDTFPTPLLKLCIREIEEAGEKRAWASYSEEEMDEFLDDLGEGDYNALWRRVAALYRGVGDAPKADLVSQMNQPSDETSPSPASSASPSSASAAGNPAEPTA